jgi:hypothetical protein
MGLRFEDNEELRQNLTSVMQVTQKQEFQKYSQKMAASLG